MRFRYTHLQFFHCACQPQAYKYLLSVYSIMCQSVYESVIHIWHMDDINDQSRAGHKGPANTKKTNLEDHSASAEPEEDVEAEERRLRPLDLHSMLGWKPSWRRACLVKWSLRIKHLVQRGQANRFSPVCVRKWRVSSSDREKRLMQPAHVHWNGLSPEEDEVEKVDV